MKHKSPDPYWTRKEPKRKAERPYKHGKDVAVYPRSKRVEVESPGQPASAPTRSD